MQFSRVSEPLRQQQLAEVLMLDGSAIVRLLDCLQKDGLIERLEEEQDRRAKAIVLTDTEWQMVARGEERAAAYVSDQALADVSADDMTTIMWVPFLASERTRNGLS